MACRAECSLAHPAAVSDTSLSAARKGGAPDRRQILPLLNHAARDHLPGIWHPDALLAHGPARLRLLARRARHHRVECLRAGESVRAAQAPAAARWSGLTKGCAFDFISSASWSQPATRLARTLSEP